MGLDSLLTSSYGRAYVKTGEFASAINSACERVDQFGGAIHGITALIGHPHLGNQAPAAKTAEAISGALSIVSLIRIVPALVRTFTGNLFMKKKKDSEEKEHVVCRPWIEIAGNLSVLAARILNVLSYVNRHVEFLGKHAKNMGIAISCLFLGTTSCEAYLNVKQLMDSSSDSRSFKDACGGLMQNLGDALQTGMAFSNHYGAIIAGLVGRVIWLAGDFIQMH